MTRNQALCALSAALALAFSACDPQGTGPVIFPAAVCEDPDSLHLPRFSITTHKHPKKVVGKTVVLPDIEWAKGDSVRAFFGGKEIKLVFTLERSMYLVTYETGEAHVTLLSHDDESLGNSLGAINSPMLSPDGKKIVFAGTTRGKPAFILDAVPGETEAWRVPLDPKARVTADPHWVVDSGKTYVYFATLPGLVDYSPDCDRIQGSTYRIQVLGDTLLDSIRTTGIAGAYRGGVSKDLRWAGTSYAASALFDRETGKTTLLGDGEQQCNPSMNPYPPGSKHTDYMMILAFGGVPYATITGEKVLEGLHENLWIYNKDNKIVWQAKRPDEKTYLRFDKPEWSTHPDFATAVALRRERGPGDVDLGDLYVIRIGDLADAEEGRLNQAEGHFKIASGSRARGFTSDTYSHLWVGP